HGAFEVGKGYVLRDGSDIAIIATGTMTAEALKAYDLLKEEGIEAKIIHMPTIKPLDEELVREVAEETGRIITCEEHSIIGGLGDAVAMAIAKKPVPMIRIGVNDVFGESGKARELMEKYGLTAENIVARAKELIEK
ncbi:MAG TPA: transketolase family protein, partial [Thermoplasmatales archaeon]|nr:transketolase family protein [Thermoplasmatales archaeon]